MFPGIVSQLLEVSQTSSAISLRWDRPSYYSGSSLTGLVQYSSLAPTTNEMWLYVQQSSDTPIALEGLEEFTEYSIQMAIIDASHMLCVFSEPVTASTGKSTHALFYNSISLNKHLCMLMYRSGGQSTMLPAFIL